jgi:hypothetical protein
MLSSVLGVLLNEGKTIVDEIRYNIDQRGVKASGRTQKALRYQVDETDSGFLLQVFGPKYVKALEDGRGPTKKGNDGGKTLVEIIREWIDDKGIVPESKNGISPTKDTLARAIASSIHKRGTNLYRHGGHSGVLSDVINEEREDALKQAIAKAGFEDLEKYVKEEIINANNNAKT